MTPFEDRGLRYRTGGWGSELATWLEARVPNFYLREDAFCIGSEAAGAITGVVAFDTFSGNDCNVSLAGADRPFWLRRPGMLFALSYPFLQLGLDRVTAHIRPSNTRCIALAIRLGFQLEGRMRRACADGEDLAIYGLLRDECTRLRDGAAASPAL